MSTTEEIAAHLGILLKRDADIARAVREAGLPTSRRERPGFATLIRIIVDQQVSTAAGAAIWRKLSAAAGGRVSADSLAALGEAGVRANGMSGQKTRYTMGLVEAVRSGDLNMAALSRANDDAVRAKLVSYNGIGPWTADIYLMFGLGRPDIWPVGDLALQVGAQLLLGLRQRPNPGKMDRIGENWRPFRSSAALLLWRYYAARRAQK